MKCMGCGKRVKKSDSACPHCGKALAPELMDTQELMDNMGEIHDELDRIGEMRERTRKTRRRGIISLIVILVCLVAGWGTMLYFRAETERAKQTAAQAQEPVSSAVAGEAREVFLGEQFVSVSIVDENSALTALESAKSQFGISGTNVSFRLKNKTTIGTDTYYRFVQVCDGVDVYDGEAVILANGEGKPLALHGCIIETDGLEATASLGTGEAANAINAYVNKMVEEYQVNEGVQISDVEKMVCNFEGETHLAYMANVSGYNIKGTYVGFDVFVDAGTGAGIFVSDTASYEPAAEEVAEQPAAAPAVTPANAAQYGIYTVNDKFNWNMLDQAGAMEEILVEDVESGNVTPFVSGVKGAVDHVYSYFAKEHGWFGLDGANGDFRVLLNANEYVEHRLPPEKALYSGDMLMFIETDMASGAIDPNVVAHEFAHGVMYYAAGLSGTNAKTANAAIAEGLADVFAELAEGAAPDWIHGERRFCDVQAGYYYEVGGGASIRELLDCYRYSTVLSRAAYRMYADGIGTKKLGELFFRSLMMMTGQDDFQDFGTVLELNAKVMHDNGTLSSAQFDIVVTALTNSGMRGERLYPTEVAEIIDTEMLGEEETDPNEIVIE